MENFSKNAKYIRLSKKLTQAEIKDRLGIEPTTWSNYERGKSVPNLELFHVISQFFGVSADDLLNKDLSKGNLIQKSEIKKNQEKGSLIGKPMGNLIGKNEPKKPVLEQAQTPETGSHNTVQNNVFDFTSKAAAGNAMLLMGEDKYRSKPNLYLPGLGAGVHIRAPIGGDSMHSTIKDGDRTLGTLIHSLSELRQGHIYMMLDKDEGLVCKRVYAISDQEIELISDNEIYKPYKRHLSDILALFIVREVHTTDLRPYFSDLRKDMREIRSEIADIRSLIDRKK